jgi:hypothetical protein
MLTHEVRLLGDGSAPASSSSNAIGMLIAIGAVVGVFAFVAGREGQRNVRAREERKPPIVGVFRQPLKGVKRGWRRLKRRFR